MYHSRRLTLILIFIATFLVLIFASNVVLIAAYQNSQGQQPPPPPPPENQKKHSQSRTKQDIEQNTEDALIVKEDTGLVLLDVTVLNKNNKFIKDLPKDRFQVFEDQVQQSIAVFSQEQVPISYGIVVDTSGSMRKRLFDVVSAAKTLVSLSKPGDEVFIVDMKDSQNIEVLEDFTTSMNDAKDALDNLVAAGGTSLLDGIVVCGDYARSGRNRRKALVVISDGDERDSVFTVNEVLDKVREYDVQLYLVGFPEEVSESGGLFNRSPRKKAVDLINKLASESGGQAYFPQKPSELELVAQKIASDLRSQYSMGYYPSNSKKDGTFRRLQVKLADKEYVARSRSGYYAPKDVSSIDKAATPKPKK